MSGYFIDTGYVLALLSSTNQWHSRAMVWSSTLRGRAWTTDYVLIEIADALASARTRSRSIQVIREPQRRPNSSIVHQSGALFERGPTLYESRPDKDWSLTDCTSFVVMSDVGLRDALTPDRHFEQAGFLALLREEPPAHGATPA